VLCSSLTSGKSEEETTLFIIAFRLPKDYHKENMSKMRKKEHDLQSKIEEERNQPKSMCFIFFLM
jgi:hypothetical protein